MKIIHRTQPIKNNGELRNVIIPVNNKYFSTENQNLSVIETGENKIFFNKIISLIQSAHKVICLQSYLIQNSQIIDELVNASNRNVKVYVMDSAETRIGGKIEEDESFVKEDYVKMMQEKFLNKIIHRQAENFHAKFIVIDPKTNPKGYLTTANFTIKALTENPEFGIELTTKQALDCYKTFVYHFWEHATDEQTATNDWTKYEKHPDKFSLPNDLEILLSSPNAEKSNLKKYLIQEIENVTDSITFSTFGFDIEHEVAQAILRKLKSGLKVKIFARPREKSLKGFTTLLENGAEIYFHNLLHAKAILFDNKEGAIFSANFESHGLDDGWEMGIKLSENQIRDLCEIFKNFEKWFPYKFVKNINIQNMNKYYKFREGKLTEQKIIENETKNIDEKSIQKVSDLFDFYSQQLEIPKKSEIKEYTLNFTAKFQELKKEFETLEKINNRFSVIKIVKNKLKDKEPEFETAILIENTENIEKELNILENYKDLNIYTK